MGNCYSANHIAEDRMHTDITCNILGTTTEVPHRNGQ